MTTQMQQLPAPSAVCVLRERGINRAAEDKAAVVCKEAAPEDKDRSATKHTVVPEEKWRKHAPVRQASAQ